MPCLRGKDGEKKYDPVYVDEVEILDILLGDE